MQCVPTGTVDKVEAGAATAAATIVIDEIGNQVDITASASTSSGHLLLMMMVMILIAAAATTAVVTFPFIERKVRLGLVESVLQLGDASPTFTTAASFRLLLLPLLMMVVAYCCCLWRWDLWLFLVLLLLLRVMMMVILVVAAIVVPQVLLPDVVLVEIEFVLFVVVVVLVRGYVPILRVAAVLGTDRPRRRFVVELDAALLLLLVIGRRVRD